jgi:hypothetical protein
MYTVIYHLYAFFDYYTAMLIVFKNKDGAMGKPP